MVVLLCLCKKENSGLRTGAGRGLIAKETVPIPGRSLQFGADFVCAAGVIQHQLPGTTSSFKPTASCGTDT